MQWASVTVNYKFLLGLTFSLETELLISSLSDKRRSAFHQNNIGMLYVIYQTQCGQNYHLGLEACGVCKPGIDRGPSLLTTIHIFPHK